MMLRLLAAALLCMCVVACGKKEPETPDPGDPSGEVRVSPGDRLGWTQQAADSIQLGTYQFALYVDGTRTVLSGVTCTPAASGTFDCSAVLPPLTAGAHTLELGSFVLDGTFTIESSRSAALRVIAGATSSFSVSSVSVTTVEQVRLNLTPIAEGLRLPSDLAFGPDGVIFVAERAGAVRLINGGVLADAPALDLSRDIGSPEGGLLAMTLDPQFADNGFMYVLYTVEAPRNGLEFTVARVRFAGDTFGERAVLLDRTRAAATNPSGALRVGPDGKLYVAFDSASDPRVAGSFATYNGKVLRLNTDATTPDDQPAANPIFSLEHPQPLALDWQPSSMTLWVIDRVGTDGGRLSAVLTDAGQSRAAFRTSYTLPAGTDATSAAFYRGDLMSIFKGNLFLASDMGRQLIRLRFDPDEATKIVSVERLLQDQIGPVRAVSEGPDGALYVATESVLYRLAP